MLLCSTYIIVALEMSCAMFLEFMCTVQTNLGSLRKKTVLFFLGQTDFCK